MTDQSPRNSFRAAIVRGARDPLLVNDKHPRLEGPSDALSSLQVPRTEARRGDHRDDDRHRLVSETAILHVKKKKGEVELINLSAGGAMIGTDMPVRLWDMVELELGPGTPRLQAIVRWIRNEHIGLEFAHETRIDCPPEARAQLLLNVIQRSFPGAEVAISAASDESPAPVEDGPPTENPGNPREIRHPLVWSGDLHFGYEKDRVRIRNISSGGALVDVSGIYPTGAEVLLKLGAAGQIEATVSWSRLQQVGLCFKAPFDLDRLANLRPDVTPPNWERPSFLDQARDVEGTPWDDQWGRSQLGDLRAELEGFLKR